MFAARKSVCGSWGENLNRMNICHKHLRNNLCGRENACSCQEDLTKFITCQRIQERPVCRQRVPVAAGKTSTVSMNCIIQKLLC